MITIPSNKVNTNKPDLYAANKYPYPFWVNKYK
jgi:hypothetical protein